MNLAATMLALALAQFAAGACLVRGTVLDAANGAPLPISKVFLKPAGDPPKPAILRRTDNQGAFCFEQADPGTYKVIVDRAGYVPVVYGARPGGENGFIVNVDGQAESAPLSIRMQAAAAISGMVVDSTGQLLEGATVALSHKIWDRGWTGETIAVTSTDQRGAFRFGQLAPGNYYVSVDPGGPQPRELLDEKGQPLRFAEAKTYWPASLTFGRASPIPLNPGQQMQNLVVQAARYTPRSVTGALAPSLSVPAGRAVRVRFRARDDISAEPVDVPVDKSGAFAVHGLLPAKYTLKVLDMSAETEQEVDLTGGDIQGLLIRPAAGSEIRITARSDGHPAERLDLRPLDGRNTLRPGSRDADGSYGFGFVPAGSYSIEATPQEVYVKSVRIGDQTSPGSIIDLRQAPVASIEAQLGSNPARIIGRVERPPGNLPQFAIRILWMDEQKSRTEAVGGATAADQAGKFTVPALPPGKYRVFAIEGFKDGQWGSLDIASALRDKSVSFEVVEGEAKELTLPLISFAEWSAALRKFGL